MTELQVAQIIHDSECVGCPAQPNPHPVQECLYGHLRERSMKTASAIIMPATLRTLKVLEAAKAALLSYAHGNSAPDLAREIATDCDLEIIRMTGGAQ